MSIERPDYTVVFEDGAVEYRQYDPYIVAETVIENVEDYSDAGNEGFRRLFRYISGANLVQAKISMTAPVEQSQVSEKIAMTAPVERTASKQGWRVAFVLPGKYTMDTAPVPADSRVELRQVPGRLVAALRFSGRWTDRNHSRRSLELLAALDSRDVAPVSEITSAVYNPPFMPPFLRRNEVIVEVDRLPVVEVAVAPSTPAAAVAGN